MLFNSLHFAAFLPVAVLAYGLTAKSYRWLVLLIASYYFYMCWKPEYAVLILASTVVDYWVALRISQSNSVAKRRFFLSFSLLSNLGLLFAFKYYGFAAESIRAMSGWVSEPFDIPSLNLLLPVGISFYTFQTLSYTIDVYRGEVEPETHFGKFAVYVSFFPQLVAGPIERSARLLPQLRDLHQVNPENLVFGLDRILWGLFKKLVVADRVGIWADAIFNYHDQHNGTTLLIASIFFGFQIYCDFSGYSDIAIGTARMLGISLMENFRRPYFASSIQEFWQRWHISLSTWFRDYVYIPLGGSRRSTARWITNVLVVFTVSGIWHGANWTFFIWGLIHGLALVGYRQFQSGSKDKKRTIVGKIGGMSCTFAIVCLAWIFFRAEDVSTAFEILARVCTHPGIPAITFVGVWQFAYGLMAIATLLAFEVHEELVEVGKLRPIRWLPKPICHAFLIAAILNFGVFNGSQFIYFQF